MVDIHRMAFDCLMTADPAEKCAKVRAFWPTAEALDFECSGGRVDRVRVPGRPEHPHLVHPNKVPRRGLGSLQGRVGLYHALAHIEFNAINLSLDAVYRFRQMPKAFYRDWWLVASEEAKHFSLLNARMAELDAYYGVMTAHNHLWQVTYDTDFDPMVRMALVPRVLEARGLDMAPIILSKLEAVDDHAGAEILRIILAEEVGHVRIGNHWYLHLCQQRGLDPERCFADLLRRFGSGAISGPFNTEARLEAGFSEADMRLLADIEAEFRAELGAHKS